MKAHRGDMASLPPNQGMPLTPRQAKTLRAFVDALLKEPPTALM
jgi:hypothetical protein